MEAAIPEVNARPLLTMADMGHGEMSDMPGSSEMPGMAGMDHSSMSGMDHAMMENPAAPEPPDTPDAPRVLRYGDLKSLIAYPQRAPEREIELRLTGNMERYFWSINDTKYSDAEPIRLRYNERVRIKFVNQTMMTHPMHLHGHWMELDNGAGPFKPRKHVISIKPGETVYFDLTADAMGEWAFHCHLLYHMATGMFRKIIVEPAPADTVSLGNADNG